MLRAIQKIVKQGNSMRVTIARQLMFACDLLPGEFVELSVQPDKTIRIRPWRTDDQATAISPGVIPSAPPEVPR